MTLKTLDRIILGLKLFVAAGTICTCALSAWLMFIWWTEYR